MEKQNNQLKTEIFNFLDAEFIMNIATCKDNNPSASVVMYVIDEDLNFYFATHSDSYKTKDLRENPRISMTIWKHRQMMVQADGLVEEIPSPTSGVEIMNKLMQNTKKDESFWPPLFRIKGGGYTFFRIKPTWIRKLDLTRITDEPGQQPFEVLEL